MCKSRGEVGLGFRLLKPFHEALLSKHLAKFLTSHSLWARVIQHKYVPTKDVWELKSSKVSSQA